MRPRISIRGCLSIHPLVRPSISPSVRISLLKCIKFDDLHQNNDASKHCKHEASISSIKQAFEAPSKYLKQQEAFEFKNLNLKISKKQNTCFFIPYIYTIMMDIAYIKVVNKIKVFIEEYLIYHHNKLYIHYYTMNVDNKKACIMFFGNTIRLPNTGAKKS